MGKYKIVDLKVETINLFKGCFDINGSPKEKQNIQWQFFENTESNCFVEIAFDVVKNKTAGIYATSCVKFKINNITQTGTQSLDTITDSDYRGKGLFTMLAKSVFEKEEQAGVALVYGFPNGNSIHGFEKKLKWQVLDPLPFLIKPLKSKYFTDKIKFLQFLPNLNLSYSKFSKNKNYYIKEVNSFPLQVNEIWENFSSHFKVAVIRDHEYLNWRYLKKPNEDYKIAHCYSTENEYIGFVVFVVKEKHKGKIGYIMELIYDVAKPEAATYLLNFAIAAIKKEKADCILSWCLPHSPNYNIFKNKNFFTMPEKIRPIELHFGARAFKEELKPIINKRENWYLSYSDSDTV
ncbi:GNAT family N-acetyltransferase [Ancylomarina sp. YFZ004]